jgi:hypothetical protein
MGHRIQASLEVRGFGSPCRHDDSDDSFRILGLGTKIMCLFGRFFTIDFHKNPGLNTGIARGVLVVGMVESSSEGRKILCPLVGETVRLK